MEGIDGCGKSTFVEGLAAALRERGTDVVVTAEPTTTWLGDAVRRSWRESSGPAAEAYLFMADRAVHCIEIARQLEKGRTVICDRYQDSTLVYQGSSMAKSFPGGLKGAMDWLASIAPPGLLRPDVTFLLELAPESAMARMSGRASLTKFERLSYLKGVHAAYQELGKDGRFATLDAKFARGVVVSRAVSILDKLKRGKAPTVKPAAGTRRRGRPARGIARR